MPRPSSLGVRVRDAKEECPKSLVRPCLAVLPLAAADLLPLGRRRRKQSGPFHPSLTAALRRELCGPAETRPPRTPFGVPAPGRDPSMVDVLTQLSKISTRDPRRFLAPGVEPSSSECRDSRRFTRFDPRYVRPLRCSLSEGRPPDELLALLVCRQPALQRRPRRTLAAFPARRVNGGREPTSEELLSTRAFESAPAFCNRRETRAHPRGERHPARSAVTREAAALRACRRRARPEPHPPAAPSPEARAWLHGGLGDPGTGTLVVASAAAGVGAPRRTRSHQGRHRPDRANGPNDGEAWVPSSREETAPLLEPLPRS